MTLKGHVENGVIVIDDQTLLPDGTPVTIEIVNQSAEPPEKPSKRQGGWWKGQVEIRDDFDELPDDIAEARVTKTSEEGTETPQKRVGGQYRGKIWIAPDFDELPDDIAEAFGMREE